MSVLNVSGNLILTIVSSLPSNVVILILEIITYCKSKTCPGKDGISKDERPWNDDTVPDAMAAKRSLPLLHVLILVFASVNRLDSSGLYAIFEAQNVLSCYSTHHVEFVNILHPAICCCLIVAHFSKQPQQMMDNEDNGEQQQKVLSVVPASKDRPQPVHSCNGHDVNNYQDGEKPTTLEMKLHSSNTTSSSSTNNYNTRDVLMPRDLYPFFHWSTNEAVQSDVKMMDL
ncbi:hypothetical protein RO3G_12307 [Rhizopus delemar RA 99-880]|uniref:STAS domain-containing protein n=1 Tax=Rhizopus delemar (strain RA 99-880 / ATCC MYA-4621 / FGSC 9543 / NRRL 43880) TaxID=246409 RepID=I1CGL6_RHIO9|nr:hypothetical protein RO3G_12307 [Rhizopus delemar RA 99-880]|eukprot:EIE87596.1 hypothetical protein RO3G_12307 [Rhizopus delemar RA 99-880]